MRIFLFGFFVRGYSFEAMLMTVVGIVVAAIPEGLPIILTITFEDLIKAVCDKVISCNTIPHVTNQINLSVAIIEKLTSYL